MDSKAGCRRRMTDTLRHKRYLQKSPLEEEPLGPHIIVGWLLQRLQLHGRGYLEVSPRLAGVSKGGFFHRGEAEMVRDMLRAATQILGRYEKIPTPGRPKEAPNA
ncbi:hypothetical protein PsorP6_001770 [Peronosclerospora sorghi]|uniref:Uncharacterized protein n=1 Tax=Peronosclerospora sorghi TaxID=230839 RepID=A0ACC0WS33_9STRA|nr:hypothetical protein PsorP6_001770 [Peronosclerospora sorghi]